MLSPRDRSTKACSFIESGYGTDSHDWFLSMTEAMPSYINDRLVRRGPDGVDLSGDVARPR
jgi:hypothetical protein